MEQLLKNLGGIGGLGKKTTGVSFLLILLL
jgi:hypothetical protein